MGPLPNCCEAPEMAESGGAEDRAGASFFIERTQLGWKRSDKRAKGGV